MATETINTLRAMLDDAVRALALEFCKRLGIDRDPEILSLLTDAAGKETPND